MKYAVNIKSGYKPATQSTKANCGGLSVFKMMVVCSKEAFVFKIHDELNTQIIPLFHVPIRIWFPKFCLYSCAL